MPTDPYVPSQLEDRPRQEPNLPPGVKIPAPRPWVADRPGDLGAGQPSGELLGSPGPDIGYALTLTSRVADSFTIAPREHVQDAVAVVAELAMRRAASFGRAPVLHDVDVATQILGYADSAVDPAFTRWRVRAIHGAAHHYRERRELVDAVPIEVLRLAPGAVGAQTPEARRALLHAVPAEG